MVELKRLMTRSCRSLLRFARRKAFTLCPWLGSRQVAQQTTTQQTQHTSSPHPRPTRRDHKRAPSDDRSLLAPSVSEGNTRSERTDCGESNTQGNLREHLPAQSTCEQSHTRSQYRGR